MARRNAISMLMSIEAMLNGVNLAILAFGEFTTALGARAPSSRDVSPWPRGSDRGLAIVIAISGTEDTPRRRVRPDEPMSPRPSFGAPREAVQRELGSAHSAHRDPAAGRVRVHRGGRPATRQGGALGARRCGLRSLADRLGAAVTALTAPSRLASTATASACSNGSRPAGSSSTSASSSTT